MSLLPHNSYSVCNAHRPGAARLSRRTAAGVSLRRCSARLSNHLGRLGEGERGDAEGSAHRDGPEWLFFF